MNIEGLMCSKSQGRFTFVFLRKLWKVLRLLLSVVLSVQVFRYCRRMSPDVPFEKDINICRKRFAWRNPILGRFEPDWKPFLTSRELFWQDNTPARRQLNYLLQFHMLPFGLKSSVLHAFHTLQLLPQQGMPKSIERLRCRRCVVVGNSNSIRGRGFGAVIDSHNIVIRLNNAPVKEHKEDVGEKTSIRLFFPESALPNPLDNNDNETLMVLVAFKSLDFIWVKEMLLKTRNKTVQGFWRRPPSEWKWNASHLRILHPYVTYEATYKLLQLEKRGKKYSTTGIIALNLALHVCHEVNIIGFGYPDKHDNTTPVHYYDTEHLSQGVFVTHNISAEQAWLLKMMEQGMISDLLRPSSSSWGP
ncbi:CMP-N-acetylneuraminate-beta-galactosamide-alpha-2,3-sialyltransferase 4-like [Caretta caretta]|uniref:CMP-N-acetylneuraminate-beta-galactosamide- alpha-2,3-sialyltransferase 4-like n=1 Tax=Caretta caretta TaxID=8467 RepID=UPI0020963134|nr:CMP-N-acetylneuraminate-beta-galactosamide-alpha-2,3-sialyltransferase 4-like [Caretta caretta]